MKKIWMPRIIAVTAVMVFALLAIACATPAVVITYTEPARVDMSGIKRVAIESNHTQVTQAASRGLTSNGYTVGTATEIADWRRWSALAARQRQAIEITAVNLARAYGENVARADANYGNGKTLRITGVVSQIDALRNNYYYVRLTGSGNDSIMVFFASAEMDKVIALNRNQTITIVGECHGRRAPTDADIAEILNILGAGQRVNIVNANFVVENDYPGALDAVIVFNTTSRVNNDSETRAEYYTDANNNRVSRPVVYYTRSVEVAVNYQVWNTRSISMIGQGSRTAESNKASHKDRAQLPSAEQLVSNTLARPTNEIIGEIVPTQRTVRINLAKETENKEAQNEMKEAESMVKARNYTDAVAAYSEIYATHKNFAAGYNHAVLTEATAGTSAALVLMEALFRETNDPMAQRTLGEMQRRNELNQRAAAQRAQ